MSLAEKSNRDPSALALVLGISLSFLAASLLARAAYRFLGENSGAPWEHGLPDAAYIALLRVTFLLAAVLSFIVITQFRRKSTWPFQRERARDHVNTIL